VGWLAKVLVTRYGGLKLYRQAVPLAIGLVAGGMINGIIWSLYRVAIFGRQ